MTFKERARLAIVKFFFGEPKIVRPALAAPPSPSMVLAEMVALEILKCDYTVTKSDVIKNRDKTKGIPFDKWTTTIENPKFKMVCRTNKYYYDYAMRGGYDDGITHTWEISSNGFGFDKTDERKIIMAAYEKAKELKAARLVEEAAHQRQLEAVKALEAWCETDPKLLKQVECVICDDYPVQIEHSGPCGHDIVCVNGDPDCKACV